MKALKKHHLIPQVAEEEGFDKDLVAAVVDCYWKEMITAVREMRHLNIEVHEIGQIRVAKSKIDRYIENLEKYKAKHVEGSVQFQDAVNKLEKLQILQEMRSAEYDKREQVRAKRKEYDKTKKNLGK